MPASREKFLCSRTTSTGPKVSRQALWTICVSRGRPPATPCSCTSFHCPGELVVAWPPIVRAAKIPHLTMQCHRLLLLVRLLTSDALDIAAHDNGTTLPRRLLYLQDRANTLANKLESTEREAEQIGRAQASLSREEGAAQERAETLEAQLKTVQVV